MGDYVMMPLNYKLQTIDSDDGEKSATTTTHGILPDYWINDTIAIGTVYM